MQTAFSLRSVPAFFLLFLIATPLACSLGGGTAVEVEDGTTLLIEIGGEYVDTPGPNPLARLAGDSTQPLLSLLGLFTRAERDSRIETVVLRIESLAIGWGKADEIRAAAIRVRESGKRVVAHLEIQGFLANKELYVASAADEIFVAPGSAIPLVGLAAEYIYLGGLWEKLGIDFDVARAGRYKSAVEVYAERTMSDDAREMANSLLDDAWARFVSALAEGRNLPVAAVEAAIDRGPVRSQELEALGLIDGEVHLDELLEREGGALLDDVDYARVDPATIGFEPEASVALIFGVGTVLQGEANDSPLSTDTVFASETVSRAILDAAEDPEIDAILLRIDSPGGSALASEIIWRAIIRARELGTPVVVSMSDVAASGGYYVASAADAIIADPGTLTGSIGVFAIRPVVGGLFEKLEVGVESLTRGRHADFLLSSEKLSPAALARLQTSVSDTYQLFLTRVADGRGLSIDAVGKVAQGRVWSGRQAFDAGLVDEVGGLYTAARRAKVEIGLDPDDDVLLIPYPKPPTLSEQLMRAFSSASIRAVAPTFEWPAPLAQLAEAVEGLPTGSPVLVPPMMIEIR
ncbi:MAG: signal peptide peptidase SppA [bacterium]|nr:signal peptide peptidase SppA [bacterium]